MKIIKDVYEGKIQRNIFGSFSDCSPGLYIDRDMITTIFASFLDKNIRITIEEIEEEE